MRQTNLIKSMRRDSRTSVHGVSECLQNGGLQVLQVFDLQAARATQPSSCCPIHGTEQCDCQMVILLVYAGDKRSVTLMVYGNDCETSVEIVNTLGQPAYPDMLFTIRQLLDFI